MDTENTEVGMPEYVLISLVSDQPMPNVMAVLQDERYFKYLEFIVSANKTRPSEYDPRYVSVYERSKEFFEKLGRVVFQQQPVNPYNLKDTLDACQKAVEFHRKKGREVVINITGGTKIMSLAAYLCAQKNHLESIYIESRDRVLISLPASDDLIMAIANSTLSTDRKEFVESRFDKIDVSSYIALHGREVQTFIRADSLDKDQVEKAYILAQHYTQLKNCFTYLEEQFAQAFKTKSVTWPFRIKLKGISKAEKEALARLDAYGIVSWNASERMLVLSEEQRKFLRNGRWIEIFTLHSLATSGLFHDVCGNLKIKDWDGECDVVLTANAKLAIIECKSEAKLSEQFGKIRSIQRDRGGLYGLSFFIRTGQQENVTKKHAKFYNIDKVINIDEMLNLPKIIAEYMGISINR